MERDDDLEEEWMGGKSVGGLEEEMVEWYGDEEDEKVEGYVWEIGNEMEGEGKWGEYMGDEEKIKEVV